MAALGGAGGYFTHTLASAPGLARIIVLDGARANPYARAGAPLASGLALVQQEAGELLAFNASPGSIAADEAGPYGAYAKTLAGAMRQGGVVIEDIFAQTRLSVNEASGGAQLPWSARSSSHPITFSNASRTRRRRPLKRLSRK